MIEINPIKLKDSWNEGFALDYHTISSIYIGDDEYGNPQFDTKRTAIGELLYKLKYCSDKTVISTLNHLAFRFIKVHKWSIDMVIPIPPSNVNRTFQPVYLLAEALAKSLDVSLRKDCVVKIKDTPQIKSVYECDKRLKILKDAYSVLTTEVAGKKVLVVDDLYRSGATLKAVTQALKSEGKVSDIYVLVFSRTRRAG
ncbi:MAG: ComF family protein [Sedimentisphaerales bacterium]|nr:ComF family protein [Sedimentisphaerales bacterium]